MVQPTRANVMRTAENKAPDLALQPRLAVAQAALHDVLRYPLLPDRPQQSQGWARRSSDLGVQGRGHYQGQGSRAPCSRRRHCGQNQASDLVQLL
eukprot:8970757-Pyramimonas_sp.AAC.1